MLKPLRAPASIFLPRAAFADLGGMVMPDQNVFYLFIYLFIYFKDNSLQTIIPKLSTGTPCLSPSWVLDREHPLGGSMGQHIEPPRHPVPTDFYYCVCATLLVS